MLLVYQNFYAVFCSFLTKLPCTQYTPIIIWRLHLLHPLSSKYYWALQRPLNKQEKTSLQVTCLVCRLPARVLSSAWGPCWLEGCSRRGVVGRRSSVWAFIAGRHAPHRSGRVSSRLGRLHGVTVPKQGRHKSNTFLPRTWAHCERVCEMVVWLPCFGATEQHSLSSSMFWWSPKANSVQSMEEKRLGTSPWEYVWKACQKLHPAEKSSLLCIDLRKWIFRRWNSSDSRYIFKMFL